MAQFGLHGDPKVTSVWNKANIKDDPVNESNKRGFVSFATAGPNTRSCQLFINFGDNSNLDSMGFSPVGEVAGDGMEAVMDKIHVTGEGAPGGPGPSQGELSDKGSPWLKEHFPEIDYITHARIVEDPDATRLDSSNPVASNVDKEVSLISRDKPAESSTRGNLGKANVVTMLAEEDWLKDRWAAQADMNGSPMRLPQWITVDLGANYIVTAAEVDWETAFARQYEIKTSRVASSGFNTIFEEKEGDGTAHKEQHVLHKVTISKEKQTPGRYVRLVLLQSGTNWGISVWHFDLYGYSA